jgi:RNA polymerase sigma-70 factor (ECF subfamily)
VGRTAAHRLGASAPGGAEGADADLADAVRGDAAALRRIYDDLAPAVHGYLRGHGAPEPEDATSEVFLAVFTRLDTVTGGAQGLRTLVFSVAHARLVDQLRRAARRTPSVQYEPERDGRVEPSAEVVALTHAAGLGVEGVLAQLPDDYRDVVLLRVVADLSVADTATVMGRSEGAVKQLYRRAVITLREIVGREGVTG